MKNILVGLMLVALFFAAVPSKTLAYDGAAGGSGYTQSDRSVSQATIAPQKAVTPITQDYSSYLLFSSFLVIVQDVWDKFYEELDKTNALGILASSLIVFSFCLMAFQLISGKGFQSFLQFLTIMVGTGVALGILQSKEIMEAIIFKFAILLPLEISSFFMEICGQGTASIVSVLSGWERDAAYALNLSSVHGLFDGLDQSFSLVWEFWVKAIPEGGGFFYSIITCLVALVVLIAFCLVYIQFLMTYIRSIATIIICAMLAPFFGALIALAPARKKILSLVQTVFYHWLVLIVTTIVMGPFASVIHGMILEISQLRAGSSLLDATLIFTVIWCFIGYSMMTSVPSIISQITEIRGASGGATAGAIAAGGTYLTTRIAGSTFSMAKGAAKVGYQGAKSFKQKQKEKRGL